MKTVTFPIRTDAELFGLCVELAHRKGIKYISADDFQFETRVNKEQIICALIPKPHLARKLGL